MPCRIKVHNVDLALRFWPHRVNSTNLHKYELTRRSGGPLLAYNFDQSYIYIWALYSIFKHNIRDSHLVSFLSLVFTVFHASCQSMGEIFRNENFCGVLSFGGSEFMVRFPESSCFDFLIGCMVPIVTQKTAFYKVRPMLPTSYLFIWETLTVVCRFVGPKFLVPTISCICVS